MVNYLLELADRGLIPLAVWRIAYRVRIRLQPYAVWTSGTDCDGFRLGNVSFCWTRKEAQRELDSCYMWADGPMHGGIEFLPMPFYRGKRMQLKANVEGWADSRDRYAEAAGY